MQRDVINSDCTCLNASCMSSARRFERIDSPPVCDPLKRSGGFFCFLDRPKDPHVCDL